MAALANFRTIRTGAISCCSTSTSTAQRPGLGATTRPGGRTIARIMHLSHPPRRANPRARQGRGFGGRRNYARNRRCENGLDVTPETGPAASTQVLDGRTRTNGWVAGSPALLPPGRRVVRNWKSRRLDFSWISPPAILKMCAAGKVVGLRRFSSPHDLRPSAAIMRCGPPRHRLAEVGESHPSLARDLRRTRDGGRCCRCRQKRRELIWPTQSRAPEADYGRSCPRCRRGGPENRARP